MGAIPPLGPEKVMLGGAVVAVGPVRNFESRGVLARGLCPGIGPLVMDSLFPRRSWSRPLLLAPNVVVKIEPSYYMFASFGN